MTRLFLLLLLSSTTAAVAADATAPVREIMAEAENGWSENPSGEPKDYFDGERLDRIYSQAFARTYRAAAKFPAFEEGDSPFDYDVIVNGQDSCALKDVQIVPKPQAEGLTDVDVSFDNTSCFDGVAEPGRTELHFMVIEEGGRPVIDDIVRAGQGGSVKSELDGIARQSAH